MASSYQYNLKFNADTTKAKQQMADLERALDKIINKNAADSLGDKLNQDLQKSVILATELKTHIEQATNPRTGVLDFSKLNEFMRQNNTTLLEYGKNLLKLGPDGRQAFQHLTGAIANSEVPFRRVNKLANDLFISLKNAAKWQISSSVMHTFVGTMQTAVYYAKDLNKSLNDIRIVSGQNADQMALFAEKANKAAKELKTTTNEYAKASLIYYQQGLDDKAIEERTAVTIKMANVTGDTAQTTSDQLTAIWNNFYEEGGKSLEYYADVITALGAATASSSEEISTGLEKFAAVSESVGLSYEYATSALATVTATTRQSAEVVGTAFKTLFARIQGLNLGETQDDGTTLNKYSQALEKVGISIKDNQGNLKDMDTILDEMGNKWNNLAKDEQVALAQTVAGVRQYTQLIALMDNWDFFKENLETANNATGALQKQADIYAESWEAASKNVQTSMEQVYSTVLNDEFFIDLLNGTALAIEGVDGLINSVGGLQGVLLALGAITTKVFRNQIASSLTNLQYNLIGLTKEGQQKLLDEQRQTQLQLTEMSKTGKNDASVQAINQQIQLQNILNDKSEQLSPIEETVAKSIMDQVRARQQAIEMAEREVQIAKQAQKQTEYDFLAYVRKTQGVTDLSDQDTKSYQTNRDKYIQAYELQQNLATIQDKAFKALENGKYTNSAKDILSNAFGAINDSRINQAIVSSKNLNEAINQIGISLSDIKIESRTAFENLVQGSEDSEQEINNLINAIEKTSDLNVNINTLGQDFQNLTTKAQGWLSMAGMGTIGWAPTLVDAAGAAESLGYALTNVYNIWQTLKDPEASGWEKLSTILFGIGTMYPAIANGASMAKAALQGMYAIQAAGAIATQANLSKETASRLVLYASQTLNKTGSLEVTTAKTAELLMSEGMTAAQAKEIASRVANTVAIKAQTASLWSLVAAQLAALASNPLTWIAAGIAAVVGALYLYATADDRARESIEKSNQAYEEQATKVEQLSSELTTLQDKIKELENSGPLSITDEKELQNLKLQEASLERTLALEQKIAEIKQKEAANEYLDNYKTAYGYINKPEPNMVWSNYSNERYSLEEAEAKIAEWSQSTNPTQIKAAENLEVSLQKEQLKYEQALSEWQSEQLDNIANSQAGFEALYNTYSDQAEYLNIIKDAAKTNTNLLKEVYGEDAFTGITGILTESTQNDLLEQLKTGNVNIAENSNLFNELLAQGIDAEAFAQYYNDLFVQLKDKFGDSFVELLGLENFDLNKIDILFDIKPENQTAQQLLDLILGTTSLEREVALLVDVKTASQEKAKIINALTTGGTISSDDLSVLGEEYNKYFVQNDEGNYVFTGDSSSIQKQHTQETIKAFEEAGYTQGDIARAQNISNNFNGANVDDYISRIGQLTGEQTNNFTEAKTALDNYVQSQLEAEMAIAATADTIAELNSLNISEQAYNDSVALVALKEAATEGFETEEVLDYADAIREVASEYEVTEEEAIKISVANKKLQKGMDSLNENWEDWKKNLDPKKSGTKEYREALSGIEEAISDILDIDIDKLPDGFATSAEAAELLDRAVSGDLEAIEDLRTLAAKEILIKAGMDSTEAQLAIDSLRNYMDSIPDLQIGTNMDISQALAGLANLDSFAHMTVSDIQGALDSLGWEPQIEYMTLGTAISKGYHQSGQIIMPDGEIANLELDNLSDDQANMVVPVLVSAKYKGSAPSIAPPSMPSGGGGGGGSSTPKKPEKKSDSDKERYHTLKNQLEDLKANYEDISEAKDRAFGLDKLDLYDSEIESLDKLINKQEEYLDAIAKDLPIDKSVMEAFYNDVIGGPTIQFDEMGNISNFDQIQDAMYNKYNSMADKYTEEDEAWEIFEKQYEQLEKYIEQYEETYDLLRDEEQEYQDLINQRLDAELSKIQYAIELKVNLAEDGLNVLEYQLNKLEDDAFKAAEAVALFGQKADLIYKQITADREGLDKILGQQLSEAEIKMFYSGDMSVLQDKNFTEDQISAIRDYRDELLDLNGELDEIQTSVHDKVLEVFEAWNEKLDQNSEKLEHYNSLLESYKNIIDIVGKDSLGISDKFISDLNQAIVDNNVDNLKAMKSEYDSIIKAQAQAEQALEEARARGDEDAISRWENTLESINSTAQSAQEDLLNSWEDALNSVAEQFEAAIEMATQKFSEAVYGAGGLEGLTNEFEYQQGMADTYLEDYEKIYELSKLTRSINNSIDETENLAGKQKLSKLFDEINKKQEEGVKLSQYDLEYLQAEYDLRLAEIALEEAQRAKDTVRLSRDNEGNLSYIYTQNSDAVDDAQQKYEDALYAMQNLSSEYIDEMSEQLIQTSQEMQEALAAIRIQDYASIDDYYAEVERVQKQYQDKLEQQENELQKAIDNNKELYDSDWKNYHEATGYKISDTEKFVTSFKDSLLGGILGSDSDSADFSNLIGGAVDNLVKDLMTGAEEYYKNLEEVMNSAGTSTGDFADDIGTSIDEVVDKSTQGAQAAEDLANKFEENFSSMTDIVTSWQETYGQAMQNMVDSNMAVIESFNKMLEVLSIDPSSLTISYNLANNKTDEAQRFASGGYTGSWNDGQGRWALLDSKELILNNTDTNNILQAVNIARSIESYARLASLGVGIPNIPNYQNDFGLLEQEVHITAEFPNVNSKLEIQEAFSNLINAASQYANRK